MEVQEIVIPIFWDATDIVGWSLPYIIKNLKCSQIVFIGPNGIEKKLPKREGIKFIDEDKLIKGMTKANIEKILCTVTGNQDAAKRGGWYLQQFIKMGYASIAESDNYLIWDADRVPLKEIYFWDETGKKIFMGGGNHHHLIYYKSISRLLGKEILPTKKMTYVADFMLMNVEIMSSLLSHIEHNEKLNGGTWWEKILYSIDASDISESGFSEYETYGEYVALYYKESYCLKSLDKKITDGRVFFGNTPKQELLEWATKSLDVLGFEARNKESLFWKSFCLICYRQVSFAKVVGLYQGIHKLKLSHLSSRMKRVCEKARARLLFPGR